MFDHVVNLATSVNANLPNNAADENSMLNYKVAGVKLYVDEHNTRAQQVYKKMGMEPANYCLYHLEFADSKPEKLQQ